MRSPINHSHLVWAAFIALVAIAIACGGSSSKSPTMATTAASATGSATGTSGPVPGGGTGPGVSGSGTLQVMIRDSPFSDAKALLVTFSDVSAHRSGDGTNDGEWKTLPFADGATSRVCDLKKLQGPTDVLGVGTLPAGHYTQLRLTVASASIFFTAESTLQHGCAATFVLPDVMGLGTRVDVPSGTLKLNREFDVPSGGATTIVLDFDGDKSVHQTGNGMYKMTPVIGVVSVQ